MKRLLRSFCLCLCLMLATSVALADSYDVEIYQPDTAIATAPIVWQTADAAHADIAGEVRRPSALIADVRLDDRDVLTAYDGEDAVDTLDALYAANGAMANFGVRIADQAAAAALAAYVGEKQLSNLWLIAADPELIQTVRAVDPLVRGVVDITAGIPNDKTLFDLVYGSQVRSVLISAGDATSAMVRHLQECDYMVYVNGTDVADAVGAYNLVISGANGILTADSILMLDMIESFKDYTLTRGGTIVGHRGEYTYPNNSLPAFLLAAQSGATAVELDVWLTTDKHLVLSHDNNMADTEQVARGEADRKLNASKFVGRLDEAVFAGTPYHYITLEELFRATAEQYPHLFYRIEIKDKRPKAISKVMEVVEQYDLRERCQLICFDEIVTNIVRKNGYATLYLDKPGDFSGATDLADAARKLEKIYRPLNSWYSSRWEFIDANVTRYVQHFGLNVQPWPTSNENDLHGHFIEGYNGMTTDYCHWANDYVKYIEASTNDKGSLTVIGYLYDGTTKDLSVWAEPVEVVPGVSAVRARITLPTTYAQNWYYVYAPIR